MFATTAPQDTMGFTYSWIEIPQNWGMGTVGDCDDIDDKKAPQNCLWSTDIETMVS